MRAFGIPDETATDLTSPPGPAPYFWHTVYMKGLPLKQAEISAFNVLDVMDGSSDFQLRVWCT